MSAHERRASYVTAPRPRVASIRVGEADKATPRALHSPRLSENMEPLRGGMASPKSRLQKEYSNSSEKRSERATTTRDKVQVRSRNSVKESATAGNRGELEKTRAKRASQPDASTPIVRRKEKEQPEGEDGLPIELAQC